MNKQTTSNIYQNDADKNIVDADYETVSEVKREIVDYPCFVFCNQFGNKLYQPFEDIVKIIDKGKYNINGIEINIYTLIDIGGNQITYPLEQEIVDRFFEYQEKVKNEGVANDEPIK